MNWKLILSILTGYIIIILAMILGVLLAFNKPRIQNVVVESYESTIDEIAVDYDDDNKQYDVFVNNKHYYVAEDEIKVLPYYKNEVVVEITKNGKCNLIFYIEYIH